MVVLMWLWVVACHFPRFVGRCIHFEVVIKFVEWNVDNIVKKPFPSKNFDGKLEIVLTAS